MDVELIRKYKAEFDYWLDGGSLLAKYPETNGEFVERIEWNDNTAVYIINDEYVDFRKALTEDKTVQVITAKDVWTDFKAGTPFYQILKNYRIKPEEPQFKVGDYLIVDKVRKKFIGKCTYTINKTVTIDNVTVTPITQCKLWTLEDAADTDWLLCWYNDHLGAKALCTKRKLGTYTITWDHIVPYIGQDLNNI